ncbi:S-layer homology domain-containing protein [Symbiobacterium terraclitae]|uniref:S-layer homology domain-containing protein n=1 Tax=Symbiobacterium terraclitae TaxID=557451 RepID=UPI0035B54750
MGLMKKLTSAVVASSLVLTLAVPALAAPSPAVTNAAFERLHHYSIVQGVAMPDGSISPALDMTLTRAQLVTIVVRAFGEEQMAAILQGASTFPDVPGSHWSSGYVAVAKNIAAQKNLELGYPDGTFQPERTVTAIEALTFVMKFLGLPVGSGPDWDKQTIASAVAAGVLSNEDVATYLSDAGAPATRGLAFALLDNIFYNYQGLNGKNLYVAYHDNEPPVVTLNALPGNTSEPTITVSGTVSGDFAEVYVGSDRVTVAANGSFSAQVALQPGQNTITVSAKDLAGNVAEKTVTVSKGSGVASAIVAKLASNTIKAGQTVDLEVSIVDDAGIDTGITDYEVTVDEEYGTYADGKFTAGGKLGSGSLTVSYGDLKPVKVNFTIVAGAIATVEAETDSVAPGEPVRLIARDASGNRVSGVTFSEDYADVIIDGDRFIALKPGKYTVRATKDGETGVGVISVFGKHESFAFEVPTLVSNGSTEYEIKVIAVDEDGNKVTTFEGDVSLDTNLELVGSAVVEAKKGVATFTVRVPIGMEGLDAEFIATYEDGDEEISASASFEVVGQVAEALNLDVPKYLAINQPAFTGYIEVVDQSGNRIEYGDTYEVKLTISGPAYFAGTASKELTIDVSGGSIPFELEPVDRYTEGTITLRATAPGLKSVTKTVEAVYARAPRNLVFTPVSKEPATAAEGEYYEFKLSLTDPQGVPVLADEDTTVTLTFSHNDADKELYVEYQDEDGYWEEVDLNKGKGEVFFARGEKEVPVRVQSRGITGSIKVTASASGLTSASGTVAFAAGEATRLAFEREVLNVLPDTDYTLTVRLQDDYGNNVAKSGIRVEFSADPQEYARLGSAYKSYRTTTDSEGKASVRIRLVDYVPDFTIYAKATLPNGDTVEAEADLHIVTSVAKTISVSTYVNGSQRTQATAGDEVQVRVTVTDARGFKWSGDEFEGRLALGGIDPEAINDGDEDADLPGFTWNADGRYYEATFIARKEGTYRLKVSDDTSLNSVSGQATLRILGGTPDHVELLDATPITYKKGEAVQITVYAVDEFGNKAQANQVKDPIEFTVIMDRTGGSYALVRDTASGGGTPTATYTIRAYTNSLRLWVITDADSATITIDGPDGARTYEMERK